MKNSMVALALTVAAFVSACQDQSVISPAMEGIEGAVISKAATESGSILLTGILEEPGSDVLIVMGGQVDYSISRVPGMSDVFDIVLNTSAQLGSSRDDKSVYSITGNSTHRVNVSEEGVVFMELQYLINERVDRLALILEFQITQHDVDVMGASLDFVE